eukprot:746846-Hanusia_phi.AAC.3
MQTIAQELPRRVRWEERKGRGYSIETPIMGTGRPSSTPFLMSTTQLREEGRWGMTTPGEKQRKKYIMSRGYLPKTVMERTTGAGTSGRGREEGRAQRRSDQMFLRSTQVRMKGTSTTAE